MTDRFILYDVETGDEILEKMQVEHTIDNVRAEFSDRIAELVS